MTANPFAAQEANLGIAPSGGSTEGGPQAQAGVPAKSGGRRLRRAAKKASQTSMTELLASNAVSSQVPQVPKLSGQHILHGRSHPPSTG